MPHGAPRDVTLPFLPASLHYTPRRLTLLFLRNVDNDKHVITLSIDERFGLVDIDQMGLGYNATVRGETGITDSICTNYTTLCGNKIILKIRVTKCEKFFRSPT
jgi:hypothetical protein